MERKWQTPTDGIFTVATSFDRLSIRLEDPDSPETKAWVQAQVKVTDQVLSECSPDQFFQELKKMHNYPKYSVPFRRGPNYFFWKNDGLQNQSVLYIQKTLTSEPEVFLDPNKLSDDGTASIGTYAFSEYVFFP